MSYKLSCPDCGAPMQLKPSRYGQFYGCTRWPDCNGTHGAHPGGKPLGTPANKETKLARMSAHAAFDRLWKDGGSMRRSMAYRVMQVLMGLKPDEAHIGSFDKAQCESLVEKLSCELAVAAAVLQIESEPKSDRKKKKAKAYWKRRKRKAGR